METILINKDKIKIMLNSEEMSRYRIDSDFLGDKTEADHIIWDILDDAAASSGFDTEGGSFYVQMYPSKSGGCELFVTRIYLSAEYTDNCGKASNKNFSAAKSYGLSQSEHIKNAEEHLKKKSDREKKNYIYRFSDFDSLLGACKEIALSKPSGDSLAYFDRDSDCSYLIIEDESYHPAEFGAVRCKNNERFYIFEHCSLICKNAVEKLSRFAV